MSMVTVLALGLLEFARTAWTGHAARQAVHVAARMAAACGVGGSARDAVLRAVRPTLEASGQLRLGDRSDWLLLMPLPEGCTAATCTHVRAQLRNLSVPLAAGALNLNVSINAPAATALREAYGQLPQVGSACTS